MKEISKSQFIQLLAKIFLVVFLISTGFQNTYITLPEYIVTFTTLIMVTIYLICSIIQIYKLTDFIFVVTILLIGTVSYIATKTTLMLSIVISLNVLRFLDKKTILKYYIMIRSIFITTIIFLAISGVIDNEYRVIIKSGINYIGRYALGYTHPNQLAQALGTLLIAIFCYICKKKINFLYLIIFSTISTLIYYLTASRTFLIVAVLFILFNVLLNLRIGKQSKTLGESVVRHYIIFFASILMFNLGGSYLLNKASGKLREVLYKVNALLSSRLSFSSAVMQNYDLSLFGTTFNFDKLELWYGKYAVDSSYINFLYSFGIVPFLMFVYLNCRMLSKLYKSQHFVLCLSVLMILLWGTMENILTNVAVNFSILLFGLTIFGDLESD